MAEFVPQIANPPFEWGDDQFSGTGSELTKELVEAKFNASLATAEDMLVKLVGVDGNSGYLGNLNAIIEDYTAPAVSFTPVSVPDLSITPDSRPLPEVSGLETVFPEFSTLPPTLTAIPTVDLSTLNPADLPEDITAAISWLETSHDTTLFDTLMVRLLADLQSGATGLPEAVEQGIYDRATARQNLEEDKLQTEIEEYFSSTGFDLPTGALSARLQEHVNGRAMRLLDLNEKIAQDQAELAQKNSQFIIQASKDLEAVLRDFTSKKNDRSLDYAKAVAVNAIAIYAEKIRAYIAAAEANKAYVEVQVENLKAAVEYNKGLVAAFAAEAEAYGVIIEAKGKKNEAITEIFKSEVIGYDAETRAISENQRTQVSRYGLILQNADLALRAAIAAAETSVQAYAAESGLREKVAEAMANIAMQSVASAYGSVNTSASLSHQTGRSESESYTHSEGRSIGYDFNQSRSESHQFEEESL